MWVWEGEDWGVGHSMTRAAHRCREVKGQLPTAPQGGEGTPSDQTSTLPHLRVALHRFGVVPGLECGIASEPRPGAREGGAGGGVLSEKTGRLGERKAAVPQEELSWRMREKCSQGIEAAAPTHRGGCRFLKERPIATVQGAGRRRPCTARHAHVARCSPVRHLPELRVAHGVQELLAELHLHQSPGLGGHLDERHCASQ